MFEDRLSPIQVTQLSESGINDVFSGQPVRLTSNPDTFDIVFEPHTSVTLVTLTTDSSTSIYLKSVEIIGGTTIAPVC
jgi:hypothetical protein